MTSAPGVSCSSPKSRRSIPAISRSLLLALITHRHGYKAHSLLSISPLLPHRNTPPGCRFASPENNPSRRRSFGIPATPVSHCPPRFLSSLPRVSVRLLTSFGARVCITERARHFSGEPVALLPLRRPIPATPQLASTPRRLHPLRRVLVIVW